MLQPVITAPCSVSSAAPTLNPEKRAWARSRASIAAATSAASSDRPLLAASRAIGCQAASLRRSWPVRRCARRRSAAVRRLPPLLPRSSSRRSPPVRRSSVLRRSAWVRRSPFHLSLEAANDPLEQRGKGAANLAGDFHHL